MSNSVEQARRELFCAWFESLNHRKPEIQYWRGGHCYSDIATDAAWLGFNAALDSICIELPGANDAMKAVFDYHHGPSNKNVTGTTNWAANIGMVVVEDCRAAIEQIGLGIKCK